jgi:hypothetical protein
VGAGRAEQDVLEHGQVREQVERLEHQAKPAPDAHRVHRGVGDDLAVQEHVAVVDLVEQVDAAQQRRLARPGRSDQRDRLVLGDGEVDAAEDRRVAVGLSHALHLEDRRGHACASPPRRMRLRACIRSTIRASGTVTSR